MVTKTERATFHSLLLAEQILGQVLGQRLCAFFLAPLKARLLEKLKRNLQNHVSEPARKVDRLTDFDPVKFREDYFSKSLPVVFEGVAKAWPCCQKWNLDYFAEKEGDQELLLVNASGLTSREEHSNFEILSMKDLVGDIKRGKDKYLRFSPLVENSPELARDLDLDWLGRMRGEKSFGNTYYMFMGGKGQRTLLHADQPCNLYVQAFGEKRWTMFLPEDTSFLYPELTNTAYVKSPIDIDNPDLSRYPLFRHARKYEVTLKAGDVLYVPPHVWHHVENLTDTVAVGYRFSSLKAALSSSITFTVLRLFSTNPPIWKTMKFGKIDTNLIWAYAGGKFKEVMREKESRAKAKQDLKKI